ncbi:hypothetical protein PoB_005369100 [Plakobranchus ocellatus]|uniref:Uncharacterized protein n=1 Tax=Plakobranchus ocellatus TaxID=259542 RepID=A0AAV4C351_9GAST|nr:hypothetical protein PoB_005369100 [Plakobranchus ocellatus]
MHKVNNVCFLPSPPLLSQTGLHRRGRVIREDVAALRAHVLALLDGCGFKDDQVPRFHLEPTPVRYTEPRTSLIAVMSSQENGILPVPTTTTTAAAAAAVNVTPSSLTTPRRPPRGRGVGRVAGGTRQPERRHRDTASYADMLIEQLLAAHANSPLTDSDTSPPSAEDAATAAHAIAISDPNQTLLIHENNNNNKEMKAMPQQLHFPSPAAAARPSASPAPFNVTEASAVLAVAPSCPEPSSNSANCPLANTTCGSTPELPTSESSDSLDIPFAYLFDQISSQDLPPGPMLHDASAFDLSLRPDSPDLPRAPYYNFPVQYSHSYARELQKIESAPQASNSQHLSSSRPTPPEACTPSSKSSAKTAVPKDSSHFVFSEPLVVSLPPLAHSKKFDRSDHNINTNYKPHLGNKTAHFDTEEADECSSVRPPIPPRKPKTDSKVGKFWTRSGHVEVGSLWVSSASKSMVPRSVSDEHVQWSGQPGCEAVETTARPPRSRSPSASTSQLFHNRTGLNSFSKCSALRLSSGHANWTEKQNSNCSKNIKLNTGEQATNSASKRRKFNDKMSLATPVKDNLEGEGPSKTARQRLFRTPSSHPATPTGNPDNSGNRVRRKKRQSPAMKRLSQQKENNALSPAMGGRTARPPLTDLYNIRLNESELLTTSSNSLTHSSEAYAKSSETSPEVPLISREEELLDRDAYYCDFTLDRQNKIDALSAKKLQPFKALASPEEKRYTLRDPATRELMVRSVEGAESSPKALALPVPLSNVKPPMPVTASSVRTRQAASEDSDSPSSTPKCHGITWRSARKNSYNISNKENGRSSSSSHRSRVSSRSSSRQDSPARTRSASSRSSRSHQRKTCTSHPIASSTFIMDTESTSPEAEAESESIYYWSIDDDASSCNLEKSYIRSTSSKKKQKAKNNRNIPRPPTIVGQDSPKNGFNITSMVKRFDANLNCRGIKKGCDLDLTSQSTQTLCREISSKHILAAAPSILRARDCSKITTTQDSEAFSVQSNISSCQATTSSMFFNRAKASIQCSSNEGSQTSNWRNLSQDSSGVRHISASEPNLKSGCASHDEGDASHSLVPTDTDTTPETSDLEERPAIPGKSSSSGSSTYTAARCRPREWKRSPAKALPEMPIVLVDGAHAPATPGAVTGSPEHIPEGEADQAAAQRNQDLLDSILTDSPKSVDSSGIFAPYNSYNSPVESVGSHNGYSSTVSSSVTSSDTNYNYNICRSRAAGCTAPPPTPPHSRSKLRVDDQETTSTIVEIVANTTGSTIIGKAQPATSRSTDDVEFKKPFAPAPHVNLTLRPQTRNQGVTAETSSASPAISVGATPRRPMSVRSDPLANQSVFAVPPGVHTGPPKIKDKKSLVRKFKKFSSHFYKKEKIQTLANL